MSDQPVTPAKVNYQGNSKLAREMAKEAEEADTTPKLKKIEGMNVVQTKKSVGRRIKDSFGGQDLRTVGMGLLTDVILPNGKDLLMDLVKEGGHRIIYGDGARRSSSSTSSIVGSATRVRTTNYNTMSSSPIIGSARSAGDTSIQNERGRFDFSNLIISDRDVAEEAVERMGDAIEEFGTVSVADLYDLLEISGNGFTDNKFGWDAKSFRSAGVQKVRDGYVLNLPNPIGMA